METLKKDKYHILYIDDQYNELSETLKLYEEEYNYDIWTASSVEQGLDTLNIYNSIMDAVILDLKFPEGSLQGSDALKKIKELYPEIPVFILTGAEHGDERQKALECLQNGAVDYFHKSSFDVEKLLIEIGKAIVNKKNQKKISQLKKYKKLILKHPFLKKYKEDNIYKGVFAYKLISTIKTPEKESYLKWTEELLRTLSIGFESVNISQLIHNPSPGSGVNTYLLFTISSKNEDELYNIFQDLLFHISIFFEEENILQPGFFSDIENEKLLEDILQLLNRTKLNKIHLFTRKTYHQNTPPSIFGYGSSQKKGDAKKELAHILPFNEENFDKLFYSISGIRDALIKTDIKKIKLKKEEIESLEKMRSLLKNTDKDKQAVQDLLNNQGMLYQITTTFFSEDIPPLNVLNSINELFYNNQATFKEINNNKLNEIELPFNRFPFLYSIQSFYNVFKLPFLTDDIYANLSILDLRETHLISHAMNKDGILIGKHYKGQIYIDPKQFQKHTYIIGKTGTGKTSVLYRMFMDRVEAGQGLALIDPHGDIFQKIKGDIPDSRKKDVIIFDPTDSDNDFAFNYLSYDKNFPEQKTFLVDELMKIFEEIYDMKISGGPIFEMFVRNFSYLIMNTIEKPTLEDLIFILEDRDFRDACMNKCIDQKLLSRIRSLLKMTGSEYSFDNYVVYITSKLTRFVDNYYLSNVINTKKTDFDFRKMLDDNKIFLVHLNKGHIGDLGVNFVGRLLFNKMIMAAYTRSDIPEEERKDFTLFIDEFQNFTSRDIVTALGETRKYRLQLVLANQTFAQLDTNTARNILSNVGSIITASVSPFDADMIVPFLKPDFTDLDLIKLDNYKFILKTLYNNKQVDPIIFESIPY